MTQFYFDIETTGFNPEEDKIITIQYQKLDFNGKPLEDLKILKEWEVSEKDIIELFYRILRIEDNWGFIPIGTNLIFDLTFLWDKFKKYNLEVPSLSKFLYDKPLIDIKYSLIMANSLKFKGAGLDQMTNKESNGKMIPEWYEDKEYKKIENYVIKEAESFLEFFEKMVNKLKELKNEK